MASSRISNLAFAEEVEERGEVMAEDVGLPVVESALAEQLLQVIEDYATSHPEVAGDEMAQQINQAMREVQSMVDFVNNLKGKPMIYRNRDTTQ